MPWGPCQHELVWDRWGLNATTIQRPVNNHTTCTFCILHPENAGLTPLTMAAFSNGVQRMKVLLKHGEQRARACWVVAWQRRYI